MEVKVTFRDKTVEDLTCVALKSLLQERGIANKGKNMKNNTLIALLKKAVLEEELMKVSASTGSTL